MDFINSNSTGMIAIATVVTSLATVMVAWFSWGTWRLYLLERRRTETSEVHLGYVVGRWCLELEGVVYFFDLLREKEGSDSHRTMYDMWLFHPEQDLEEMDDQIPQLIEIAEKGHPDAMSALLSAREQVGLLTREIPELRRMLYMVTSTEPDRVFNLEQLKGFRDALARLAATLRQVPEAKSRQEIIAEFREEAALSSDVEFGSEFEELLP